MSAALNKASSIFISYSRKDYEFAALLADRLKGEGFSIVWDQDILPGVAWDDFLSQSISAAGCVISLVSANSAESSTVADEIATALSRRVLIPVLIEKVPLPSSLARIQAASLINWEGDPAHPSFQTLLRAIHYLIDSAPSSAGQTRLYKESQRSAERRAEDLYQENLRSQSTLDHVDLDGTPLYAGLSWNLTPGINVLLGRNGYGKTYLVRALLSLLQYQDGAALETLKNGSGLATILREGKDLTVHFSNQFFEEEGAVGKLPVLAIPDVRFMNRSSTALSSVTEEAMGGGDRVDLARFGAWHFLLERPYENMIQSFLYGLCVDYFERGKTFDGEQFALIRSVVRDLTDRSFDFERVAREGRDRFTLYVRTEGNDGDSLPIQKASQGTVSVIAMFGLIYEFLRSLRQNSVSDVTQRTGIVIIDEVDAHLHPVWQQKIVSLLRDRFPRVQFIITAHNPIVVAGCLEDEVSVLRKQPDKGFALVQFPNDFIGWRTEDIYSKVFEIETPDETFTRFNAMRPFQPDLKREADILASKPDRTPAETRSLDELQEKLLYIDKAAQAGARRLSQEELERNEGDNIQLLADAQRARTELEARIAEVEQRSRELETKDRRMRWGLSGLILILLILLAWLGLRR